MGISLIFCFVGVWKEAPIKSFIFCSDFGSTTIKLLQWHESVFLKHMSTLLAAAANIFGLLPPQ